MSWLKFEAGAGHELHGPMRPPRQRTSCPPGEAWRLRLPGLGRGGACTAVMFFLGCSSVQAQDADITVGLMSTDPVVRGIGLGSEGVSLQMAASYYSGARWFITFGAATLRRTPDAPLTLLTTERVGYTWRLSSDWGAQLGYSRYTYPLASSLRPFDFDEIGTTYAYRDLAFMSISGLRKAHAKNERDRWSLAYDLVGRLPLRPGLAMTAGVGYGDRHRQSGFGYAYGHIGLGARVDAAQLEVLYIVTDNTAKARFGARASNRWTASLRWSF